MPFAIKIEKDADIAGLTPQDVRKAIAERSEQLDTIFREAGDTLDASRVTSVEVKDGRDLATQIEQRNNELSKLGERATEIDKLDKIKAENEARRVAMNGPAGPNPGLWAPRNGSANADKPAKSWGQHFVESPILAAARNRQKASMVLAADSADILHRPMNAVFKTTAGWAPMSERTGRVVLDEQREIEITDILPLFPTTQAAIVYMEETTFTNAAAERAEEGAYAESALALTERSVTVRSIGTSLPVTDEQLADEAGIQAYLESRLAFMVRQKLDSQIIAGDGNAPNLIGTLAGANLVIQTQAKAADSTPDAVYKAIVKVRVTGRAQPNVVLAHPTDWQAVRLLTTADGIYIWGSPSEAGPDRIWGLPVVQSSAVTENSMIVGDYARYSGLYLRQGVEVLTGFVNDDFTDGRVTIRAGLRCAVVHFRPNAFCSVTGV